MAIIGTSGNDVLNGTALADIIEGLEGNDTINAGDGDDIIYGGTGNDQLFGEGGNDTFIEDQITFPSDVFNGGAGIDTIELRAVPNPIQVSIGSLSPHSMTGVGSLVSIEKLRFASQSGEIVQGALLYSQLGASGLTEIIAGAGRDLMIFATGTAGGTFTMPTLTYTDFAAPPTFTWENTGDALVLTSGAGVGVSVTLNAAAGLNIFQSLTGGAGNDTLNGSANADLLNGNDGVNVLNGNGGNDTLAITNVAVPNSPTTFGPPTQYTGAGSTLDGGTGSDALGIGGVVYLEATLVSIEGVHLMPEFIPSIANTIMQEAAVLVLDSAHMAMLPTTAFFQGVGTVALIGDDGQSLNSSTYVINSGSEVSFALLAGQGDGLTFTGHSGDDFITLGIGAQTAFGGSGDDWIAFGIGNQSATGGAGADLFAPGIGSGVITDFTIGEDRLDFSNTGITTPSRLFDLEAVQQGADVVISADSGGEHFEVVLQNVQLSALSENDALLATSGGIQNEGGTDFDDLMFGFEFNDQLHGNAGNDRLYSGGGADMLYGDAGDDVIILDGPTTFPVTLDGGTGNDVLMLRAFQPGQSSHSVFGSITGIESIAFDSLSGETLVGAFALGTLQSGISAIEGGDGSDILVGVVSVAGSYSLTGLNLVNWNGGSGGDRLSLIAAPNSTADFQLIARTDFNGQALAGALGNDELQGSGFDDRLSGGGGDDAIYGNGGNDIMIGGTGDDGYRVDSQSDLIFELAGEGHDGVLSTVSFYLYDNVENLNLAAGTGNTFGVGNALGNVINGNEGENLLLGGLGDDILDGGTGNDALFGEDGDDGLSGSAGIDYLVGGAGNDVLDGGEDADALYGEDGDDLLIAGDTFHTDILVGGAGNDMLVGQSGQANPDYDEMDGGSGNDTYHVDTSADLTYEAAGGGTDTVYADITVPNAGLYLYANVENLILVGTTAFGVGNELDNELTGSASGNWLLGGLGNDLINGKAGNDVLFGESGTDTFVFEVGTGGDVIGDFQAGTDKINLVGYGLDFAALQTLFVQVGNVGAIQMINGDVIVLHNVTMAQLTASDFVFG